MCKEAATKPMFSMHSEGSMAKQLFHRSPGHLPTIQTCEPKMFQASPESRCKHTSALLEDGKGWGHKRGEIPENTLLFESRAFQGFSSIFQAFLKCIFRGSGTMKNACEFLDSKNQGVFRDFSG